ncbi:hypothetical protein PMN64_32245, partial [Bradyrhizobium sp. UFLA01-814]|uniref:hypothetical protein n=1 Tax=Bradyrhizobium sp. UFLA01-814 TaxID=3023480 RepID=UPI00398B5BC1
HSSSGTQIAGMRSQEPPQGKRRDSSRLGFPMKPRLAQLILIVAALMLLTLGSAGALNTNGPITARLTLPARENCSAV